MADSQMMTIRLPIPLHKALKHHAVEHEITLAHILTIAAQRYLEEAEREKASA